MEQFIQLTLLLIFVIVLAKLAAPLSKGLGVPAFAVQLLTGILLGPSGLNFLGGPIVMGTWGSPSPSTLHTALKILAEIGLIQLMFLAGLQTDWQALKKRFKPIFFTTISGFVLTAMIVAIITRSFVDRWSEALGLSAIMVSMSFGISIHHFNQMRYLGSHMTNLMLGSAVINGLLAILLMIVSLTTNYAMTFGVIRAAIAVSWFLGKLIMFFAIAYFLTSRFLKLVAKTGFEKRPRQMLIGYLLLVASLYAWAAMHFGSFAAVGVSSLGGALLGMSNLKLKEKISERFESAMVSLPVGMLFLIFGMEVNFREAWGSAVFLSILFTTLMVAKFLGFWVIARRAFDSFQQRIFFMFGGLPQGEIGMLIAAYLFSRGVVNPPSFNSVIIVVVMLTMFMPVVMKIISIRFDVQVTPLQVGEFKNRSFYGRAKK